MSQTEEQEKKAQDMHEDVPISSRSWLAEIQAALKREKDWRDEAKRAIDRYTGRENAHDERTGGSFNILWSNTELLRHAIYSQAPTPEVRQRWEQKDPLSLAVSQVVERSLEYIIDVSNFDTTAKRAILDYLLPGRSVIRVRYEPEIIQEAGPDGVYYDKVTAENVVFETVSYKDFVCHDALDWTRCEWIAFRHYVTKAEAKKAFPEYAEMLSYVGDVNEFEEGEHSVQELRQSDEHTDLDAKALVWEIWDRRSESVIWVTKNIPVALLRQEPPLELSGFYPIARPMVGVIRPDSLMPTTIFSQYENQAIELDILTERIRKTSELVKWRGIYDASLGAELESLFDNAEDGELVPTNAATMIMERGGFGNMFWTFPIEDAVKVLSTLYDARDKVKETIYEITGISDILRGVSNQYETASAQKIKAAWGGSRVDGYKREVQRFIAETLRIAAEVVSENYATETIADITGLSFPRLEEKQQWQMERDRLGQQLQQMEQMMKQMPPPQEGQPNPAQQQMEQMDQRAQELDSMLETPAWEEIDEVLKSDLLRSYKITIETDSTIAPDAQKNIEEIQQTMSAIGMFGQQFVPAVEKGICPPQLFSKLLYAVIKKTPLANEMAPYFDQHIKEMGGENPIQKELDEAKKELEEVRSDRELKEKELDIKAREAMQKGRLEARKLEIEAAQGNRKLDNEAAKVSQQTALEQQRMQQDMQQQVMQNAAEYLQAQQPQVGPAV